MNPPDPRKVKNAFQIKFGKKVIAKKRCIGKLRYSLSPKHYGQNHQILSKTMRHFRLQNQTKVLPIIQLNKTFTQTLSRFLGIQFLLSFRPKHDFFGVLERKKGLIIIRKISGIPFLVQGAQFGRKKSLARLTVFFRKTYVRGPHN